MRTKTLLDRILGFNAKAIFPAIALTSLMLLSQSSAFAHLHYHRYRQHRHSEVQELPHGPATATRSSLDRTARALMSRSGGFDMPAQPAITGQVGQVTSDTASIYAGREDYGRLLSSVSKGDQIVVTGQTDTYYAVAMSNHTIGFILKTDVQLMSWQVTTSGVTDTDSGTATAAQSQMDCPLADNLLQAAMNYKGVTPYVWGGNTIQGIDCSGFVKAVYEQNGIELPRTAADQAKVGYAVPLSDPTQWMPGDRIYFECHHDYIDHTGLYMGNGFFIHSSINHHGVDIDKIATPYYWQHLVAVRRSSEMVAALQTATSTGQTMAKAGTPDMESTEE